MFRSPHPDVEIPDLSVFDYLFGDIADADLDRVAMVDGPSGAETSYRQLIGRIEALAGALAARGLGVGDVIGLLSPNVPVFAVVFHGILRSGATATTVNALYTGEEVARQLRDSGATWLFTVSPLLAAATEGAAAVGIPAERVVVLDGADGHPSLADLLGEQRPAPEVSFDPATHVAVLPYSSGTTGRAKGVMLSHRNLVANVVQCQSAMDLTSADRVLAVLPFFHIYGMTVLLNIVFQRRGAIITMPRFDLAQFLTLLQDQHCTYVFVAPPIALALAKHPMVNDFDLSGVRGALSGAAPLDGALADAVAERLGWRVVQGYGMTEMSPVSHTTPADRFDLPSSSVGVLIAGETAKLIDVETGEEIEPPAEGMSRPGELLCAGPNIMLGYLNDEESTRNAFDADGFLRTGDIATVRSDGATFIVDRAKELIKYKGYQIPPAELEALLLTHPAIADAAVIGVRHDDAYEGEEVPKAFVVLQSGAELDADAVQSFVAEHVAPYKKVRYVEFVDAIPKASSGKILRKDLRAREAAAV